MKKFLVISIIAMFFVGCTSINVRKVDAEKYPLSTVCIIKNPKVLVSDFLSVLEKGFNRHGIAVELYSDAISKCCEYSLSYTARRRWDIMPFMTLAELELKHYKNTIGTARYKHGGGFDFSKFAGTESKMNPVIDELLSGFELASVPNESFAECAMDKPDYIPPENKTKAPQSNSIEIIESYGRIIFSNIPKKSRLHSIGITVGDNILSVNSVPVNKNNIEFTKEVLKEYQLEISILGKGTALIRGHEVIQSF